MIDMTNGTNSSNDLAPSNTSAPGDEPAPGGGCCGGAVGWLASNDAEVLAHQLAAIADPVRLQVLSIIANAPSGEVCACDFVGPIDRSQPTISHHLKVLAEVGLVEGDKRGRWVWYQLAPSTLDGVLGSVADAISGPVPATAAPADSD
jgi:ArsR family transcriptional regulator